MVFNDIVLDLLCESDVFQERPQSVPELCLDAGYDIAMKFKPTFKPLDLFAKLIQ